MKKCRIFLSFSLLTLILVSCGQSNSGGTIIPLPPDEVLYLDKPEDTNLEFWITERATSEDLLDKGCTYLPGWMGAEEYLDSRYTADTSESMAKAPDTHVTYLLTGYPDTLDKTAITHIEITDPSITVYGLTINSNDNEVYKRLKDIASSFSNVMTLEECYLSVTIKKCTFDFMREKIIISVPVTNNSGIEY